MTTDSHLAYHRQLLVALQQTLVKLPPFNAEQPSREDEEFMTVLSRLCEDPRACDDDVHLGQQMINAIVTRYPHITPMVPRDLFWFFGGDCLHFLGDEEIAVFQQLDETYHDLLTQQPDAADYAKLRASAEWRPTNKLN